MTNTCRTPRHLTAPHGKEARLRSGRSGQLRRQSGREGEAAPVQPVAMPVTAPATVPVAPPITPAVTEPVTVPVAPQVTVPVSQQGHVCAAANGRNDSTTVHLPIMGRSEVEAVRQLESAAQELPQVHMPTDHVFHAGMYARTIKIPAGVVLTGAQIKIPTILIISGDALVFGEDGPVRHAGYHVALGECGRKQAFYALHDTYLTMLFPTAATTVDAAEMEFTDEYEKLFSRKECE